ncbi:MAG: Virginiamycin B lyase [Candidatus Eremiobacteraeota bacterium]|nr:Virginiamycin B lyase [Candidatus Eremiobacteraeota bacterium]
MSQRWIVGVGLFFCLVMMTYLGCSNSGAPIVTHTPQPLGAASLQLSAIEYHIPTVSSGTLDIAAGPDGDLWFTETAAGNIGKVSTSGVFSEFHDTAVSPSAITVGPDGNLWFVHGNDQVGRITTAGTITEFSLGPQEFQGIASGPDGNLWLTENHTTGCGKHCHHDVSDIVVLTTGGSISATYPISSTAEVGLGHIVAGSDNNLWFIETETNEIGRITTSGAVMEFPVPTASSGLSSALTRGPDGNIWFVETVANQIGKITPAGTITEYPIPSPLSGARGIAAGPDGKVWFTENRINQVGRIGPLGLITEFRIPTASSAPIGITKGPDGDVWFVESGANKIAKARP